MSKPREAESRTNWNVAKPVAGGGAMLALLVAAAPSSASVIYIGASTNGTTIVNKAHGSTPDAVPVTWSSIYDGLGVIIGAQDVQPSLPRLASIDLDGVATTSSGTVYLFVSETGLTPDPSVMSLDSFLASNSIPAGWSVTETTWEDNSDARYGMGTLLATDTFGPGGPYAPPTYVSLPASISPYSLTEEYEINWTGVGVIATSEKIIGSASPIPEASTWAMMVAGMTALGFAGFRKTRKNRLAPTLD